MVVGWVVWGSMDSIDRMDKRYEVQKILRELRENRRYRVGLIRSGSLIKKERLIQGDKEGDKFRKMYLQNWNKYRRGDRVRLSYAPLGQKIYGIEELRYGIQQYLILKRRLKGGVVLGLRQGKEKEINGNYECRLGSGSINKDQKIWKKIIRPTVSPCKKSRPSQRMVRQRRVK